MKNWFPISLVIFVATLVKLMSCAALSGSSCGVEHGDVALCLDKLDCSNLPYLPAFPFSLLTPIVRLNESCWLPNLSGTASWTNSKAEHGRPLVQQVVKRSPKPQIATTTTPTNVYPTPQPTGTSSPTTTVHIASEQDFALLLPNSPGELISDAESDGVAFCTHGSNDASCGGRFMQDGFIRAAAITHADDGSWIQVTGCIDSSKSSLDHSDDGGQFDVRFPNGAQCTFGGYAASFIEQIEPANSRFCLRCCASQNDQVNCNSHQDRSGCLTAIPGNYSFPAIGVDCS